MQSAYVGLASFFKFTASEDSTYFLMASSQFFPERDSRKPKLNKQTISHIVQNFPYVRLQLIQEEKE